MMSRPLAFPSRSRKDNNMGNSLSVIIWMTVLTSVCCTCPDVPEFVSINETDTDVVIVNVSSDASSSWTMDIRQAGPITSLSPYQRALMMSYFNLTQTNNRMYITVTKALDLQNLMSHLNYVTISVRPVNQFTPVFENAPFDITVSEYAPILSTIFRNYTVTDADVGQVGQFVYKINPYVVQEDENGLGRSTQTTLTVHVKNVDDLPPVFIYPGCGEQCLSGYYSTRTNPSYRGLLKIEPGRILAVDGDNLTNDILYSIIPATNDYHKSFTIDQHSGEVTQIKNVSETFILIIQATENTPNRHSSIASLLVNIGGNVKIPISEKSTISSKTSLLVPLIVLAVLAPIVIAVFVILFLVYWTRFRRTVNGGENSPTSPVTSEEIIPVDKPESKTDLLSPVFSLTIVGNNNRLPPLATFDMSTETRSTKMQSRRKYPKEPELLYGTWTYVRETDTEFYEASDKSKPTARQEANCTL